MLIVRDLCFKGTNGVQLDLQSRVSLAYNSIDVQAIYKGHLHSSGGVLGATT